MAAHLKPVIVHQHAQAPTANASPRRLGIVYPRRLFYPTASLLQTPDSSPPKQEPLVERQKRDEFSINFFGRGRLAFESHKCTVHDPSSEAVVLPNPCLI